MTLGPIDFIVLEFPGNRFRGEILPDLLELVDKEIIRRVIRRHMNEVKFCYERELQRNPTLRGAVRVELRTVGENERAIAIER